MSCMKFLLRWAANMQALPPAYAGAKGTRLTSQRNLMQLMAAAFLALSLTSPAHAALEVDITKGVTEPMPLAVPAFQAAGSPGAADLGAKIASVVASDLERSGLFRSIDAAAFIEKDLNVDVQPRFADWRAIKAQALINGRVTLDAGGKISVDFRLWDIYVSQQTLGLQYSATSENWRRVAHKIADAVYERLTGEKGYFDTRVVFVSESGPRTKRVKRLAVMDQDGANVTYLTDGSYTVLTPRFSPNSQKISFLSYKGGRPQIYVFDIATGQSDTLGSFGGMSFAPRFTPNGKGVLFSMEREGDSDIYQMDLATRKATQLTRSPAIETSPSASPDGASIVFNSDRGGSPQLYVMDAAGGNVRRISFGSGDYSTPVWSPRGDWIAFTKQKGALFQVGVIKPDGSAERILAESYMDEGPTWSPNGRVLMFFREGPGGDPVLMSVDLTGKNLRRVPTPGAASDPAWSPLIE